jgi:hypothetical protein
VAPIEGDAPQIPAIGSDGDRRSSKGDGSVERAAAPRQTGYLQERLKWPELNHRDPFECRLDGVLVSKEEVVLRKGPGN